MTSANVIEYSIFKNGDEVGQFRKHILTKYPLYSDLLKYQPLAEHEILAWGYNEDDEYWEDDESQNLEKFLKQIRHVDKTLVEYFKNKQNEI
jgi:hypothetical protein